MIAARSDRALARILDPLTQDARNTLNGIWTDTLDSAGYPRENAQHFIELTHYLLRGLFLVTNWLPYQIDRSEVVGAWHRLAPTILKLAGATKRAGRSAGTERRPRLRKAASTEAARSASGKNQGRSL
jgi:hypothetical protein